jgi:cytidylate kinase
MACDSKSFVVAIDGPAGAGKSTVARSLADRLGYLFLDSGALYRVVALAATRQGVSWDDGVALARMMAKLDIAFQGTSQRVLLSGDDVTGEIRHPDISEGASRVSAQAEVRAGLLDMQRRIAACGRVVAEGRDMGTVVFPDAQAKFFLTAPLEERARRRTAELLSTGRVADQDSVLSEMRQRDERDSTRLVAPLRCASDAIRIDSAGLTPDAVVGKMLAVVRERGG